LSDLAGKHLRTAQEPLQRPCEFRSSARVTSRHVVCELVVDERGVVM
jgi:hypothetical protein